MNKLTIIGNLVRDPELRQVQGRDGSVSVCDFTVAVNRRQKDANGQPQADFFRCTAWRQLAENCSKYLAKGRKVCVIGQVSVRTYTGNDGATRANMEVNAEEVEFLTPRGEGDTAPAGNTAAPASAAATPPPAPHQMGFTEVETDDLPF